LHFAQTQSDQIANECVAVHELSAPPILNDIEGLRKLASHITATARQVDLSQRQFNSMLSLEVPPQIVNTDAIERDIVAISFAEQSQFRLEKMQVEMSSLVVPPEWIETHDISRSLRVLEESQNRLDTTSLAAEHCTSEFLQSAENLRTWVAENPICATCGSSMDADRLLDQGRLCEGDHSHG
jgi:exonuclease SbcC